MSDELISVIVPVFNREKYLRYCIGSIISQTYTNLEIILVDDGSTDKSREICEDFEKKDSRIKVIHQKNGGVSSARNAGIEASTGEYIMFVDSDDTIVSVCVEFLYNTLKRNYADISSCKLQSLPEDILLSNGDYYQNITSKNISDYQFISGQVKIYSGNDMLVASLKDEPISYGVVSKLFKKEIIKNIFFVCNQIAHEDSLFLYKVSLKQPNLVVSNEIMYNVTISQNSLSRSNLTEEKIKSMFLTTDYKVNETMTRYPKLANLSKNAYVKVALTILENLALNSRNMDNYKKKCIALVKKYKKSFIAVNRHEKILFFAITHNLFHIYCLAINTKKTLKAIAQKMSE